jgi:hypothetical protein
MGAIVYEVKLSKEHFQEVWEGRRHHYVGADLISLDVNDLLMLHEYDTEMDKLTERRIQVRVTAITRAPFGPVGWCVLSLQHLSVEGHMCCALRRERFGDES